MTENTIISVTRLVIVSLMVIASAVTSAQERIARRLSVGGHAGMTLSRVQFNPSIPQSFLNGIIVGARVKYVEEKHFGLIGELNFVQRGWKEKFDGYDFAYQHRTTYINLPVMTHIYFGSEHVRGFFNAGPEISFLLSDAVSANFAYTNAFTLDGFPANVHSTDQYTQSIKSRFEYGICAGVGMEVSLRQRHSLTLEGRFTYGLKDLFPNHNTDPFSGSSSLSIDITLGYLFTLGK